MVLFSDFRVQDSFCRVLNHVRKEQTKKSIGSLSKLCSCFFFRCKNCTHTTLVRNFLPYHEKSCGQEVPMVTCETCGLVLKKNSLYLHSKRCKNPGVRKKRKKSSEISHRMDVNCSPQFWDLQHFPLVPVFIPPKLSQFESFLAIGVANLEFGLD